MTAARPAPVPVESQMNSALRAASLATLLLAPSMGAQAGETLKIMFPDMAPYIVAQGSDGKVVGPVAERIEQIAAEAGMKVNWVGPVPRARVMAELEAGKTACHPNARMTEEREGKFKFSAPVFNAAKLRVVVRRGVGVEHFHTFLDLVRSEKLTLGYLLGASFGSDVDKLILESRRVSALRGSPRDLLRVLKSGRVDYILFDVNDFSDTAAVSDLEASGLEIVQFPDLPDPLPGRIMCSLNVPDSLILSLNEAIARLPHSRS